MRSSSVGIRSPGSMRRSRPTATISGGAERITLVGKQTGPKIEGDVTNGNCGLHFTVTKGS